MNLSHLDSDELEDYLATCFVHLTRDDTATDPNGGTARENLSRIINEQTVLAVRPHCLHANRLSPKQSREFRVACFSQTPVHRLHRIVGRGWNANLEPFGIVFSWAAMKRKGIVPVQYVNSHVGFSNLRRAADRLLQINETSGFNGDTRWMLPYLSAWHERIDFSWEREWRIVGDVTFNYSEVVCVVLPEKFGVMRSRLKRLGLKVVSSEWSQSKVLRELVAQYQGV